MEGKPTQRCCICKARHGIDFKPHSQMRDKVILHMHHVVPRSAGGGNDLSNLIFVCTTCHGKIHSLYEVEGFRYIVKNNPEFFVNQINNLKKK